MSNNEKLEILYRKFKERHPKESFTGTKIWRMMDEAVEHAFKVNTDTKKLYDRIGEEELVIIFCLVDAIRTEAGMTMVSPLSFSGMVMRMIRPFMKQQIQESHTAYDVMRLVLFKHPNILRKADQNVEQSKEPKE